MGPLKGVMKLVPGMGRQLDGLEIDDRQMARVEAIVLSMTPHERRTPHLINGPGAGGSPRAAARRSRTSTGCSRRASRWRR